MKVYVKDYKNYNHVKDFSELNAHQAYELELKGLQRVRGYNHMCQLIDYNTEDLTLTTQWAGLMLDHYTGKTKKIKRWNKQCRCAIKQGTNKPTPPIILDFEMSNIQVVNQCRTIFEIFKNLDIVHLDLEFKNICVENNQLTIIDFGCIVLDKTPASKFIEDRYRNFLDSGGYDHQEQRILNFFNSRLNRL
jgi:hypothetical protein